MNKLNIEVKVIAQKETMTVLKQHPVLYSDNRKYPERDPSHQKRHLLNCKFI